MQEAQEAVDMEGKVRSNKGHCVFYLCTAILVLKMLFETIPVILKNDRLSNYNLIFTLHLPLYISNTLCLFQVVALEALAVLVDLDLQVRQIIYYTLFFY